MHGVHVLHCGDDPRATYVWTGGVIAKLMKVPNQKFSFIKLKFHTFIYKLVEKGLLYLAMYSYSQNAIYKWEWNSALTGRDRNHW